MLTPRRVALAAAEALAEGLLGLPVKENWLAEVLVVAWCQRRKFPLLLHCRIPVFLVVEDIVGIVGVVVGTVAGEGRRRRRKAEIAKVRGVEIRYSPTIEAASAILAKPQASIFF